MTLNRYEIFCKIIEMGSLTKAAEVLNMTQSAVSHALKNFEKEVGLPLVLRERTGVKLTPMGEELYGEILSILNANEQFQQHISRLKGLEVGTLKIATFSSVARVWMPRLLKMFQKKFPDVDVKLYIGYYHEIYDMIKTGIVDFGFLPKTVCDGLNFHGLIEDPFRVVVDKDHPISQFKSIPLSTLNNEQFILPEWGLNHDVEQIIKNHHLKLNFRYKIQEDQTIIAMVRQGLGLSILPMLTLQNNTEDIAMIPLEENYQRFIGVAYGTTRLSPVAKQFISMTCTWLDQPKINFKTI